MRATPSTRPSRFTTDAATVPGSNFFSCFLMVCWVTGSSSNAACGPAHQGDRTHCLFDIASGTDMYVHHRVPLPAPLLLMRAQQCPSSAEAGSVSPQELILSRPVSNTSESCDTTITLTFWPPAGYLAADGEAGGGRQRQGNRHLQLQHQEGGS